MRIVRFSELKKETFLKLNSCFVVHPENYDIFKRTFPLKNVLANPGAPNDVAVELNEDKIIFYTLVNQH